MPSSSGGVVHVRLESEDFSTSTLEIAQLKGEERLMGLFWFDLDMVEVGGLGTTLATLSDTMGEALGSRATLVFEENGQTIRQLHGMICEVDESVDPRPDKQAEAGAFRMRFVPRAHSLSLVEIHEVFLGMTIPQIITEKLGRIGLAAGTDVVLNLAGTYPVREFVVQYKETDLAFITRLCEHYGITYYFEHEDGVDKLVFVDDQAGFDTIAAHAIASGSGNTVIKELRSKRRVVQSSRLVTDYNPSNPQVDLRQNATVASGTDGGVVELVTKFKSPDQGTKLAGIRAEQTEAHHVVLYGKSGSPAFRAGVIVSVSDAPTLEDATVLLTRVGHHVVQAEGLMGGGHSEAYENSFDGTRGATQYRPPFATPRPRVHGVVTAFIEEYLATGRYAVMDDRGRYWVRFEFDASETTPKHSLPVRMLQPHAGPFYGTHMPLKPGTEVMVTFLDGDVDRPVIVGAVPNDLTHSPVNRSNYQINKLMKTETGIVIEARDVWEPDGAGHYQQRPETT